MRSCDNCCREFKSKGWTCPHCGFNSRSTVHTPHITQDEAAQLEKFPDEQDITDAEINIMLGLSGKDEGE